jgi:hypothetical protein
MRFSGSRKELYTIWYFCNGVFMAKKAIRNPKLLSYSGIVDDVALLGSGIWLCSWLRAAAPQTR